MPKSSGSGSGAGGAGIDLTKEIMDATAEYEKVWQEAFDKMQNKAMEWADKIEVILREVNNLFETGELCSSKISELTSNIYAEMIERNKNITADYLRTAVQKID